MDGDPSQVRMADWETPMMPRYHISEITVLNGTVIDRPDF